MVSGEVVDAATGAPVPSGFVVLLDSQNREVARVLAGADGRFMLGAPRGGAYRLRSERIGYVVTVSPPFELLPGRTHVQRLSVEAIGVGLAAVQVTARTACPRRPDRDPGTAAAWGEVNKALAAAEWMGRQQVFRYRTVNFVRDRDPSRTVVAAEAADTSVGQWRVPFASVPAADLAARGFVVAGADSTAYYGPDAAVIRDSAFLSGHCFGVARREHRGALQIGLTFAPVPGHRVPDVQGVLWLDAASAELRSLEFSYTRLPDGVEDDRIGGTVEFVNLPSGEWIVRRWELRMPRLEAELYAPPVGPSRRRVTLRGFRDIGGEVIEISTVDGRRLYPPTPVHGPSPETGDHGPLSEASGFKSSVTRSSGSTAISP